MTRVTSDPTPSLSPPRRKGVTGPWGDAGWDRKDGALVGPEPSPEAHLDIPIMKSPSLPGCGVWKPLTPIPPCLSSCRLAPTPQENRSGEVAWRE